MAGRQGTVGGQRDRLPEVMLSLVFVGAVAPASAMAGTFAIVCVNLCEKPLFCYFL